jgi:hypothetical protein
MKNILIIFILIAISSCSENLKKESELVTPQAEFNLALHCLDTKKNPSMPGIFDEYRILMNTDKQRYTKNVGGSINDYIIDGLKIYKVTRLINGDYINPYEDKVSEFIVHPFVYAWGGSGSYKNIELNRETLLLSNRNKSDVYQCKFSSKEEIDKEWVAIIKKIQKREDDKKQKEINEGQKVNKI